MLKSLFLLPFPLLNPCQAEENHVLPKELSYDGKPLPASCLETLAFGEYFIRGISLKDCSKLERPRENPNDIFRWSYLGKLRKGIHAIYTYQWPEGAMSKFSNIIFLQR